MQYIILILLFSFPSLLLASFEQGIYVSQNTLESQRIDSLIKEAKEAKIDTFVIDMARISKSYGTQIQKVKDAQLKYVARVVVFPGGGSAAVVKSQAYWENVYKLVEAAVNHGADEIQLDYIRYASKNRPSHQNALDVHEVIKWFKNKLKPKNIPLQIDVFGIACQGESKYIGQDLKLFSETVDVMSPMTYPSHFEPYVLHSKNPYNAVKTLLDALNAQIGPKLPFRLIPYIETSNYRYPMSNSQKQKYILEQIRAAKDAGAVGWYAWSPNNAYANLFAALNTAQNTPKTAAQK